MRLTATDFQHEWPSSVNALGNRLRAVPGQRYHGEVLRCKPGRSNHAFPEWIGVGGADVGETGGSESPGVGYNIGMDGGCIGLSELESDNTTVSP